MTFVRAQKFAAGVHLMTDWRVTDERSAHPPSFLTGTLKAWILSPHLCVAYAGNVSAGINRLRDVQGPAANGEVTEVLMQLRSSSQRDGVEYALATAPDGQLFRIVNDHVEPVEQLWLGEPAAWQKYGDIFERDTSDEPEGTLTLPPEVDHVSASGRNRMNAAFDKLIREGGVDSVGELAVGVRTDVSGFQYCTAAYVGGGYGQIHVPDGVPTLVDMGTPETGTFDWALLACKNAPAVALYFAGAHFGAVFCPARFEEPVTAAGASMSEFIGRAYDLTTLRFEDGIEYSRQSVDES